MLIWMLKNYYGRSLTGQNWFGTGGGGSCEHSDRHFRALKVCTFLTSLGTVSFSRTQLHGIYSNFLIEHSLRSYDTAFR
jgi:hypothetical protein